MWNQWPQYAAAPPLPTTAPPPPPQEPTGVTTPVASTLIGPMLPSATPAAPLPATPLPAAAAVSAAATAMPSALGANPYSQYTAAQYAAMTPEQQFALQQHWQQWQKYQEEYARWHAQYGEQYKREMELAQKTSTPDPSGLPPSAATTYASSYYQQPPPSAPSSKITGQPQLYAQPPPLQAPQPASGIGAANPPNYSTPEISAAKSQQPSWQPPSFNQPPPNFSQQNFNSNNPQFQSSQFGGNQHQGGPGGASAPQQDNSDNSQFNNRNRGGNNWQGSPGNRGPDNFNNRPGNRNGPNTNRGNNYGTNNRANNDYNVGNAPPLEEDDDIDEENMPIDNEDSLNSGPPNDWNDMQNYTDDRNQGRNNRGNNRNQNNWNDGYNNRGNNGPKNFNNNQGNRGPNDRNLGANNRGSNNRNQGPNNRGSNNWNDSPNNRGNNNMNDGPNNRGNNNWNDGPYNRGQNNWNDGGPNNRGANNRNDGPNNRGQNNWNDGPSGRNMGSNNWGDNRAGFDRNFGPNSRGPNNWNDGPNSNASNDGVANQRSNDRNDRDRRGSDNWDNNSGNNRGAQNQKGPGGPSGPSGNRSRITDMDEEMFDRQFRQWEQQFEDWKKANANHPDKEMYRRYEQEFEKQRKRIAERREQMRRRKLEQMGLDPNQPPAKAQPPQAQPPQAQPPAGSTQEAKTGSENFDHPDPSNRKRNDSIGSQHSKQEPSNEFPISANTQAVLPPAAVDQSISDEPTMDNKQADEAAKHLKEPNPKAAAIVEAPQQQIKNTGTPLGKRKSRFDTPVPATKKPVEEAEVITLDDDDGDAQEMAKNQGNMSEIFKKVDGIPGLDLADDNSSKDMAQSKPESNLDQSAANAKKIPSLFDIKVNKPDMIDAPSAATEQTVVAAAGAAPIAASSGLPDLAKTLNDPDFLKRISEAVAQAKGGDSTTKGQQDTEGNQLSFAEWQQRKQTGDGVENDPNETNSDFDNTNSREGFLDRGGPGRGFPNNMGPNNSNNNFGPNNANNWGPDNNNGRNWGPNNNNAANNWGRNGPNNNPWGGPNGPNNWGPNGPNNNNNNFGPNGPNNWGPNAPNNWGTNNNNFGPNGPNSNWGPNNGPNNWGPNGPNNNFGPNGPNNWGPNNGPNNFGGNNFRGGNNFGPGRNFGGNGPNDGPPGRNFGGNGGNDGRNFGRNDGPGRNFGRNANNFGRNNGGPNRGPNDDPDDNFNRKRSEGNRRRRSRGSSNDRRGGGGGSDRRSTSSNSTRDISNSNQNNQNTDGGPNPNETAAPNRNINNPFRRTDVPPVADNSAADSQGQADSWTKGPDANLDYGDYYRPVQVIDYSNSNATPTTTITPRVIDYGHKPVMNDDNSSAFKPLKIINYDHASKAQNSQQQTRLTAAQKRRNRKNNKNNPQQQARQKQQQQQQQQNQQNRKQQMQQQNQKQLSQNSSATAAKEEEKKKAEPPEQKNIGVAADCEKREKSQDELEEISDVDDIPDEPESPPPPPPPMFTTGGTFTPYDTQNTPSSIFPSTSEANENIPKMSSAHVQMSIPTEENNNTISIDEILMKPGRQTRPKKICMILRGPPGSGKSYVAKLIKEKEKEMGGNNPRILSIDDYFIVENDYEEKCPKTGKKIPKKELLYEYDKDMEEKYLQYLIKAFKKSVADNFYDFIVIDCNNNSLRSLNEFYCHSKDSGYVPYIIDLFCDLETCLERNIHERTENDIKQIIATWKPTPGHYIKLDISSLLQNVVEMEDADDMVVEDNTVSDSVADDDIGSTIDENKVNDKDNDGENFDNPNEDANDEYDEDDSTTDSTANFGFLKSKWETDTTTENLARLDGTSKLAAKRKPTMEEYLQMDEWVPPKNTKGKKRVRWADIEEKREQEKMRAVGFVVGQTDWKRMMDPNAAKRALNKTKYIERVNKKR